MFGRVALTPIHAALSDMYSGTELASSTSQVIGTTKGISRIIGNPIGVSLSAAGTSLANVAAASSAMCASAAAYLQMPETRVVQEDIQLSPKKKGSINPFTFVKLFTSGHKLAALTTASALIDIAEFTFDVENILYRTVGMDARLMGLLQLAMGMSSIISGSVAKTLISRCGPFIYTHVANSAFV